MRSDTSLRPPQGSAPPPAIHSDPRKQPVGAGFKTLYGAGALVDGLSTAALTYFLLFYLTSVCGLSGTVAGAAMLIALLIDGVADPLIGLFSDNTRSRRGRRYPYMLSSTAPLAILFGLLFSIPQQMHGWGLVLYTGACAIALRISLSVFNLPYVAVGAEVSDDYVERSSIVSYRICFTMLGAFLAIILGLGVFMNGPHGLVNRKAYALFGWSSAAILAAAGLISAFATRQALPRLHAAAPGGEAVYRRFFPELLEMFRNRSFVVLFSACVAFFVAQGVGGALALYLNRYFWKLPASAVQLVLIGATLGPFVGAPATAILSRRVDKKALTIANFVIFSLCQIWPPLARVSGLLQGAGSGLVATLFCNAIVSGAVLVGAAIGAQSMMADAADEHEHLFGVRREGLFFSGLTLAVKSATGLGGFIAGAVLDFIHFPTAQAAKGSALALQPHVVRNLGLLAGALPAAITMLAPIALLGYSLTRSRHLAILDDLQRRRS